MLVCVQGEVLILRQPPQSLSRALLRSVTLRIVLRTSSNVEKEIQIFNYRSYTLHGHQAVPGSHVVCRTSRGHLDLLRAGAWTSWSGAPTERCSYLSVDTWGTDTVPGGFVVFC